MSVPGLPDRRDVGIVGPAGPLVLSFLPVVENIIESDDGGIIPRRLRDTVGIGGFPCRSAHGTGQRLLSVAVQEQGIERGGLPHRRGMSQGCRGMAVIMPLRLHILHCKTYRNGGCARLVVLEPLDDTLRNRDPVASAVFQSFQLDGHVFPERIHGDDGTASVRRNPRSPGRCHLDVLVHRDHDRQGRPFQAGGTVRGVGGNHFRGGFHRIIDIRAAGAGGKRQRDGHGSDEMQ